MRGVIGLAAALALTAALAGAEQVVVPDVTMEDQFEKAHDVKAHRGSVLVLIYGDKTSASANRALGEQLHVRYHPAAKGQPAARARTAPAAPVAGAPPGAKSPDVVAVPVACVGPVPNLVRKLIRAQVKGGSPDVPVWLDFADAMKSRFPFKPGVPNVVVLDAEGRYRYAAAGAPTRDGLARLYAVIDSLRREAMGLK
jgi:hypothetical protein